VQLEEDRDWLVREQKKIQRERAEMKRKLAQAVIAEEIAERHAMEMQRRAETSSTDIFAHLHCISIYMRQIDAMAPRICRDLGAWP
jgi:hypothetical protein